MKKWIFIVLVALVAAIGIFASKWQSTWSNSNKSNDKLVMVVDQSPVTLDPIAAMDTGSGAFLPILHAPLLVRNKDAGAMPVLAESVAMADDGMSCLIRLRPEASFWDGSPVTSKDVIYSFLRFKQSGHPFSWSMNRIVGIEQSSSGVVSGLKASDEKTLEVRFSTPDPDWPWFIASPLNAIVKEGSAERPKEEYDLQVIGAGPFKPEGFDPGRSFRFARNGGFPIRSNIERIEVRIVENAQRQLELVQRGEVDIVRLSGPMIGEATTGSQKAGQVNLRDSFPRMKLVSAPANEEMFILLNLRSGPFSIVSEKTRSEFKRTMGSRLATPEVMRKLYGPFARPVHSISPRVQFDPAVQPETELVGIPKKARLLVPNVPDSRRFASLIAAQAKELGLEFEVSYADLPDAVGKAIGGDFDAMVFWIASQPAHQAVPWTNFFDERTGFTALGQAVPKLGDDVERIRGIADESQRNDAYDDLIRSVSASQSAWIPIASRDTILVVPENLSGEILDWNGVPVFYGLDLQ